MPPKRNISAVSNVNGSTKVVKGENTLKGCIHTFTTTLFVNFTISHHVRNISLMKMEVCLYSTLIIRVRKNTSYSSAKPKNLTGHGTSSY
jgi:hypothetical protein